MMEAGIMVHHAANRAARSAVVVIREPSNYVTHDNGNLPSNDNYGPASSLHDERRPTLQMMKGLEHSGGFLGTSGGASGYPNSPTGAARLFTVRAAAQMKTLSISPHMSDLHGTRGGSSVKFAMGNGQSLDDAGSGGRYARDATGVQVSGLDGWAGGATSISVGVAYVFPCMVPVAQTLICGADNGWGGYQFEGDPGSVAGAQGFVRVIRANISGVPVAPQIYMPGETH